MEGEAGLETQDWDECLPPRLFATERYPDARLNIYSKPKILLQIQDILKGTDELQRIKDSSFGQLWDIPFSRCPISCKLVYALLCRQVLTKKKYELWTVFGGHPLRFSLAEFGYITGLECGDFPEEYKPNPADEITAADVPYWRKSIGDNFDATLEDIHEMLSSDDMPGWRRLGLALILLVDGVLIARHQKQRTVPTPKYVAMLEDVEAFMRFPWGRESFLRTAKCMIPAQPQSPPVSKRKKVVREADPVAELQRRLQQKTVHLEGFPLALQLLALKAIPALLSLTPDPRDLRTLSDTEATGIPKQTILNIEQVREAENNSKLTVDFLVPLGTHDQWEDEIRARKTTYMEQLIREGFVFKKSLWPGGYSLLPLRELEGQEEAEEGRVSPILVRKEGVVDMVIDSANANANKTKPDDVSASLVLDDDSVESGHCHLSKAIDTAKSLTTEVQSCVVDIVVDPSSKVAECVKVSSPAEELDCYIPSAEDQQLFALLFYKPKRSSADLLHPPDKAEYELFVKTLSKTRKV
ncbi:hypothetical protein AALP_AA1G317600, partial [Arabis alpina]